MNNCSQDQIKLKNNEEIKLIERITAQQNKLNHKKHKKRQFINPNTVSGQGISWPTYSISVLNLTNCHPQKKISLRKDAG